ncbi:response regulator [Desulfosoma caldarium]|uniref:Phosphate regulon transcriptional regulatory protein PhoB n=1 Tax=Desulfosoma caldarium TaxID=610254 RepID=A0A3N1UMM6_9BACT|nr:response regulator [Desulfosoma caldarium]ROQ90998.1 two-component system phosphate regulon response regulator PhoB [Desulfosoma caldarium]
MARKKILVVEDDKDILNLVAWHLKAADYEVLKAEDGVSGLETARREKPNLIVLDLMLPGMDGLDVCKALKRHESTAFIPIIMLTARGEEADRILGLELGGDDYMVKPFSPKELVLRVQAVMRRSAPSPSPPQEALTADGLRVDAHAHRVWIDDREVSLTATEFKLLLELMTHKGRVMSRDRLLDCVWGYQFEGYARTVDTHIRRLRQKLQGYAGLVETVRGVGYRFRDGSGS